MSASGLEVFDKSLQTTNIWLDEIMAHIGPDRRVAWHVLGTVLRSVRDRITPGLAAHLGAQLPLIVRGAYYDQYSPLSGLLEFDTEAEFLAYLEEELRELRNIDPRNAAIAVFGVLSRHVPEGQIDNVRNALPSEIRTLWDPEAALEMSVKEQAGIGRDAQNARDARNFRARPEGQRRRA